MNKHELQEYYNNLGDSSEKENIDCHIEFVEEYTTPEYAYLLNYLEDKKHLSADECIAFAVGMSKENCINRMRLFDSICKKVSVLFDIHSYVSRIVVATVNGDPKTTTAYDKLPDLPVNMSGYEDLKKYMNSWPAKQESRAYVEMRTQPIFDSCLKVAREKGLDLLSSEYLVIPDHLE